MTDSGNSDSDSALRRVTNLEEKFAFLDRAIQHLDEAILRQQKQLDALDRKLGRLTGQMQTLESSIAEEDRIEDEKPPHY